MKNKQLYIFILLVISFLILTNRTVYSQTDFDLKIEVIESKYESSNEEYVEALFTVSYLPGTEGAYLSIGAQDPTTFLFDMIITNLYLPGVVIVGSTVHTLSYRFNLNQLIQNNAFPNILTCFVHILTSPGFFPFEQSTHKDTKEVTVSEIKENAIGSKVPQNINIEIETVSPPEHTVGDTKIDFRDRTKSSFNLDLDNENNGISSTFAGDLNACVPTATANSMQWMNKVYNDVKLPDGMTLRKTMEELSKLMGRSDGDGTTDEQMISGKLKFIEKYNLPIEVKFQSHFEDDNIQTQTAKSVARNFNNNKKIPEWKFLKKMMRDGEDVEINYMWLNADSSEWLAHSVNVTGFVEYTSGVKKIQIEHDMDQDKVGGTIREIIQLTETTTGWMKFARGSSDKWIQTVVAESPIIEDGRETAAWINELFLKNNSNLNKTTMATNIEIEVALNGSVTDLENYLILLYNGETGLVDTTIALSDFTSGALSNGLKFYTYNLPLPENSNNHFGVGISYTGSIIENQLISIGGMFIGLDGDATQMPSNNIGSIEPGSGFALSGFGESYSGYNWDSTSTFSSGVVNENQSYTNSLPDTPQLAEPLDGAVEVSTNFNFVWNKSSLTNSYTLEVASDNGFSSVIFLEKDIRDTSTIVKDLVASQKYFWRVKSENGNGGSGYSDIWNFNTTVTGLEDNLIIPKEYSVSQNYPNPFNPSTKIRFGLPLNSNVEINIYNSIGELVEVLFKGVKNSGHHSLVWNAKQIPSGIYFYSIKAISSLDNKKFFNVKKMILLK